jgi:enoyl-CoA hydratase/carnithine racemase
MFGCGVTTTHLLKSTKGVGQMTVETNSDGGRVDVVLSRPDVHNAIDLDTWDRLAEVADEIAATPDIRVVVFRGEGASFSSGIDTTMFGAIASPQDLIARAQAPYRKIAALEMPTIAAVHGHAYGAGLQLALVCDIRVVTSDAKLGLLEARYGLIPDLGATARLADLVGPGNAMKMMWLAEKIDGETAGRLGLAEVLTAPDDLTATVDDLATRLAAAPPLVVAAVKRLVSSARTVSFETAMDEVGAAQKVILKKGFQAPVG